MGVLVLVRIHALMVEYGSVDVFLMVVILDAVGLWKKVRVGWSRCKLRFA